MQDAEVLSVPEHPFRTTVLHQSDRTRVSRIAVPGGTVIRKEPLGPGAEHRLRHELAALERLRGVRGVVQLAKAPTYPGSIVLQDVGGASLGEYPKPFAADELIKLALALARAVARVHASGVLHRDISPTNVVVSGAGAPYLIDFALATSLGEFRPAYAHQSQILGSLAYLAPEQTGRAARPVDQRADLYALGATFYELATGQPPFEATDPMQLIHDHLTRVPTPPAERRPGVPGAFSEIVMHLLEKEPDDRYQTAEGVVYDLSRLRRTSGRPSVWRVGERDVPSRLLPPSRLVGRDPDVVALADAFEQALEGRCRAAFVGGVAGVGKTALVDELRPIVAERHGWFVAGKFDQYRQDLEFDGVRKALRALGQLLLAEPEDRLAELRTRIVAALGANRGLVTALLPEFAALLPAAVDRGDPMTAQLRTQRAAADLVRAVASPERPLALFVDDLQWAGRTALGFVDAVVTEDPIDGLLLLAAYRGHDVDLAPPLGPLLDRWRQQPDVRVFRLDELPVPDIATMVGEMLHVARRPATELAEMLTPHTRGNPYETVELLNALYRANVLHAAPAGFEWENAAVRARLGPSQVAQLLTARVATLPTRSRELVERMACIGGEVDVDVLETATGEPAEALERRLAPLIENGILVVETGAQQVFGFRHDRLREAILDAAPPARLRGLQLGMARRLAGRDEFFAFAAEQYLSVADTLTDPVERHDVVGLMRRAADQAALIGDFGRADEVLAVAHRLVEPGDIHTLVEVHTSRHAALFGLGRLEQADDEYATITRLTRGIAERAGATALQLRSLTHRRLFVEAASLGVDALRSVGVDVPDTDQLASAADRHFDHLDHWLDQGSLGEDLARPALGDAQVLQATVLIFATQPAARFSGDIALTCWLGLEAIRIWVEHGSGRTLLGPATHAAYAAAVLRSDYGAAYRTTRRILELGEARGYEPETSIVRFFHGSLICWFEPIENEVAEIRRARAAMAAAGELAITGYTYFTIMPCLLDCGPTLESCDGEVEAGIAFGLRSGDEDTLEVLYSFRLLITVLRGNSAGSADQGNVLDVFGPVMPSLHKLVNRAIGAAILGDQTTLSACTAAAVPLLSDESGYAHAQGRLLRGLALAAEARDGDARNRAERVSELDEITRWVAARAADMPDNFTHLLCLLDAERAWAVDDFRAAAMAFDAARRAVAHRSRPWHEALINEHAARFYLSHGLDKAGLDLLAEAREQYRTWGAAAKVAQLDWAYPTLTREAVAVAPQRLSPSDAGRHTAITTGTMDLLGVLSASQALSSETSIEHLRTRMTQVLSAMTGATGVQLLMWSEARRHWLLAGPADGNGDAFPEGAESAQTAPLSVVRYAQRLTEPLVVDDAVRDERFARDPYFASVERCSFLALPIVSRGVLRAMLLLENRLIRGAFTSERLEAVKLIAGQLAVSLDNAQLYAELTASRARILAAADQVRRRIERDVHDGAQQRLVTLGLLLRAVQATVPAEMGDLRAELDRAATEAMGAMEDLREIARGIHPAVLTEGGLRPAVKALTRRALIPVELHFGNLDRLPDQVEIAAYYVIAEALTNAVKHANASVVTVEVDTTDQGLRVSVSDDGDGGANFAGGGGLFGLKDRVEAIGGVIQLQSPPGKGTRLLVEVPLTAGDLAANPPRPM